MREIGYQCDMLVVLLCKLLHGYEFMSSHFSHPNRVDREEYHIFLPLFQDLPLDLNKWLEFQRINQVHQKRQSLLDALAQFHRIFVDELPEHLSHSQWVSLVNLADQLPNVGYE